jgi:hypothetical protein
MKKILCLSLLSLPLLISAQDFNASLIADSLKKNANIVTRYEERIYEIKSPGKAVEHEKHIYTILNESADYLGKYKTKYGTFNSINYVTGTLFDNNGKKIKHFKLSDMSDYSANDESLMQSERYKEYSFYYKTYPYTVEFDEEDDITGQFFIDGWTPQGANNASVEHTKYVLIAPKNYVVRYKSINCSFQPIIREEGDKKIYTWEVKNLPAKSPEVLAPTDELFPRVDIAPSDFEAQGYKGNMSNWENYGKFINQLIKGRDVLPDEIKKKVHELTDKVSDKKEKVFILYDFLQKNTRYISVQLGIGGWQPFDANYVANKHYGDCKALSNYMIALLKEANIDAKYVEIWAGENVPPIIEDFSCFQGNHVTCCVPMGKDSIWLECTSQTKSAGYAGGFTGNRKAILIDENGGHIVQTPRYNAADNLQLRKINATINEEGNLSTAVETIYKAERQDELELYITSTSQDRLMEYRKSEINLPTYDVSKINYKIIKNIIPSIYETLVLTAPNYAQVSGRRLFIAPDILTKSYEKLKVNDARKYDIDLNENISDIDSVEIKIPTGYQPESVPHDVDIKTQFGKYAASVKVMPDKILYYRNMEQYSGRFPAKDYNDLVEFYDVIYKADRTKIVLVKKD